MYNVKISGFNTQAEAEAFIGWYSGSGEQEAEAWFQERARDGLIESTWMGVNSTRTFPLEWEEGNDTIEMVIEPLFPEE